MFNEILTTMQNIFDNTEENLNNDIIKESLKIC